MCTVAFVPLPGGGYLLGHNRDERTTRGRGAVPSEHTASGLRFLAPRDPDAGGTWIAANEAGLTVCVLNAVEIEGRALPDAPRSRGLLVAEAAGCRGLDEVRRRLDGAATALAVTRAFRLVAAGDGAGVLSCVWDGRTLAWEEVASTTLYVSSTLGAFGAPAARRASWEALLEREGEPDERGLSAWLATHEPVRGPASVCMHRDDGGTVSRTVVRVDRVGVTMTYTDGPPCTPFAPPSTASIPRAAWSDRSVR